MDRVLCDGGLFPASILFNPEDGRCKRAICLKEVTASTKASCEEAGQKSHVSDSMLITPDAIGGKGTLNDYEP